VRELDEAEARRTEVTARHAKHGVWPSIIDATAVASESAQPQHQHQAGGRRRYSVSGSAVRSVVRLRDGARRTGPSPGAALHTRSTAAAAAAAGSATPPVAPPPPPSWPGVAVVTLKRATAAGSANGSADGNAGGGDGGGDGGGGGSGSRKPSGLFSATAASATARAADPGRTVGRWLGLIGLSRHVETVQRQCGYSAEGFFDLERLVRIAAS